MCIMYTCIWESEDRAVRLHVSGTPCAIPSHSLFPSPFMSPFLVRRIWKRFWWRASRGNARGIVRRSILRRLKSHKYFDERMNGWRSPSIAAATVWLKKKRDPVDADLCPITVFFSKMHVLFLIVSIVISCCVFTQFCINGKIAARFFIYSLNYVNGACSSITFHSAPANIRTSTADVTREPGSTPWSARYRDTRHAESRFGINHVHNSACRVDPT